MTEIYFTEDVTIDWYNRWNVLALNRETHLFENVSHICYDDKVTFFIDGKYLNSGNYESLNIDTTEEEISKEISKRLYNGEDIVYLLFSTIAHRLVGFVRFNCK